jgi:hypothetical protein
MRKYSRPLFARVPISLTGFAALTPATPDSFEAPLPVLSRRGGVGGLAGWLSGNGGQRGKGLFVLAHFNIISIIKQYFYNYRAIFRPFLLRLPNFPAFLQRERFPFSVPRAILTGLASPTAGS